MIKFFANTLIIMLSITSTQLSAQPSSSGGVKQLIDDMAQRLPPNWAETSVPSINQVPEYSGDFGVIPLKEPIRGDGEVLCPAAPRIRSSATPPYIEYTRELFYYHLFLENANLFYLATDQLSLEDLDRYINETFSEVARDVVRRCRTQSPLSRQPFPDRFETLYNFLGYTPEQYDERIADLYRNNMLLADYAGGLPLYFVLLHEVGHLLPDQSRGNPSAFEKELLADEFAIEVIQANMIPATLAAGHVILFHHLEGDSAPETAKELACRIKVIAEADMERGKNPPELVPELGPNVGKKISALRDYYISKYGGICGS